MRSLPMVLLVLSFPAGVLAYALTVQGLEALQLGRDGREILLLFVPLLVAGLVMMPFLIPYLDQRAKADLAAIARQRATGGEPDGSPRSDAPGRPERDRVDAASGAEQREPGD